jgi:hypothetical protein
MQDLPQKVLDKVKEIKENYEPGTISEVLETLKDHYSKHTDENKEIREGIIDTVNLVRDLVKSIVSTPTPPAT